MTLMPDQSIVNKGEYGNKTHNAIFNAVSSCRKHAITYPAVRERR